MSEFTDSANEINFIMEICKTVKVIIMKHMTNKIDLDISQWSTTLTEIIISDYALLKGKFYSAYQKKGILFPNLLNLRLSGSVNVLEEDVISLALCRRIEMIKIKYCTCQCINKFMEYCPNLISINLTWKETDSDLCDILILLWPASIKSIRLTHLPVGRITTKSKGSMKTDYLFLNLKKLYLKNCIIFDQIILRQIISYENLVELIVKHNTPNLLNFIMEKCPLINRLSLCSLDPVNDHTSDKIKDTLNFKIWPKGLKYLQLGFLKRSVISTNEPFLQLLNQTTANVLFPSMYEIHFIQCDRFSHADLIALGPNCNMHEITPLSSMINPQVNLLHLFPNLIRINLKSAVNIDLTILTNWLCYSNATQFEIMDQDFFDFNLADLVLELIKKRNTLNLRPISWIKLSLVKNILPSHLFTTLSDLMVSEPNSLITKLVLIVEVWEKESSGLWCRELESLQENNTASLDIVIN